VVPHAAASWTVKRPEDFRIAGAQYFLASSDCYRLGLYKQIKIETEIEQVGKCALPPLPKLIQPKF